MKAFDYQRLLNFNYPPTVYQKIAKIYELKGRHQVYRGINPKFFERLSKKAQIDSVLYALHLNGSSIKSQRVQQLLSFPKGFEDSMEEWGIGYHHAIMWLLENKDHLVFNERTLFQLYQWLDLKHDASFREIDRAIFERSLSTGERKEVYHSKIKHCELKECFVRMIEAYQEAMEKEILPLLLIPAVLLDVYCLEPFFYQMKPILILVFRLLLSQFDFSIIEVISIEKMIEERQCLFEMALNQASKRWNNDRNQPIVFIELFLEIILEAYQTVETLYTLHVDPMSFIFEMIQQSKKSFSKKELLMQYPHLSEKTVANLLYRLKKEGRIISQGSGRKMCYLVSNQS